MSDDRVGALQAFRDGLVGQPLSYLWRGYGSAIFLEFGHLSPRTRRSGKVGNHPEGELGLMIEWSWRVENSTSILCGSWSQERLWEPTFDLLRSRLVVELSVVGRLPEIVVALTESLHVSSSMKADPQSLYVSSFMTADGDPSWALFDRRGDTLRTLSVREGSLKLHTE